MTHSPSEARDALPPANSLADVVRSRAERHPGRVAVSHEGRETTFAELDRGSSRVARALAAAGVEPGERVCLLDKGHVEALETIFGIGKAGAVSTPVNYRLAPPELAYVIHDARARVLLVGHEFAPAIASIEGRLEHVETIVRWGDGPRQWHEFGAWRDAQPATDPRCDSSGDATAWQLYTSGTTGHPKGAELTHANLLQSAAANLEAFGEIGERDTGLVCMPLYHIGGAGYALCLLNGGARQVLTRDFVPRQVLELIPREGVTHALFVPAMLGFLLQDPACAATDFRSLRTILYGAAPIPEELLHRAIQTFACDFVQAYGLTESTGAVTVLPARDHVRGGERLRSCGRPMEGVDIRIVAPDGARRKAGEVGEILIRGPGVMRGYWRRPEASAEALRDGWLHTGDAGYLDEDGHLYIHDRVKDMIVSGGENVYPAEVESVLYAHPAVADVAVIGVPDARWGETVKALVVIEPGASATAEELMGFCESRIAGFKRPRSVEFVDSLPRNPTGKLLKRELREPYWRGRSRRVS